MSTLKVYSKVAALRLVENGFTKPQERDSCARCIYSRSVSYAAEIHCATMKVFVPKLAICNKFTRG